MYAERKEKKTVIGASCKAQENVRLDLDTSETEVKRAKYVRLVSTYTRFRYQ